MHPAAIQKARRRLASAAEYVARMERGCNREEFVSIWADFVHALGTIFSALEQGAKATPQSRQWFGGKKRERHDDPLLSYLHHSRNEEEHGLADVTRFEKPRVKIVPGSGNPQAVSDVEIDDHSITLSHHESLGPVALKISTPAVFLTPFVDSRDQKTYCPPAHHLGEELGTLGTYPLPVAELGLAYAEEMVAEAESFLL